MIKRLRHYRIQCDICNGIGTLTSCTNKLELSLGWEEASLDLFYKSHFTINHLCVHCALSLKHGDLKERIK